MVRKYVQGSYPIEPGSFDKWTAFEIDQRLEEAANRAREQARKALEKDLEACARYVYGSEIAIDSHGGKWPYGVMLSYTLQIFES